MKTLLQPFAVPASDDFRTLVRADGVRLWDDQGREYIDALASLWYCQVGHGRPELIEAITSQLTTMATYNTFPPFTNLPAERAAARIAEVSPFADPRVFLCNSGSESVDTGLKIARLVAQLKGEPDRQIIVRRTRGYHGVNIGGTSVQGIPPNREGWGDLLPHVVEVDGDDIESAARLFADVGDRIAGVICEPLQGAGGVFPPTDGYLAQLRTLCDRHGALLVFDEVICGFGRTGQWFASQTYDVMPDLLTFAKGVTSGYQPMGGVIISRAVADVLEADPEFIFRHGYTYSGHPTVAAAAVANIDVLADEGLVDRANHIGDRFSAGLQSLADDDDLAAVRGVGAVWGAQLAEGTTVARGLAVRAKMLDLGVVVRCINDTVAFCPPLVIDDADIDRCIDVLAEAIRHVPIDS